MGLYPYCEAALKQKRIKTAFSGLGISCSFWGNKHYDSIYVDIRNNDQKITLSFAAFDLFEELVIAKYENIEKYSKLIEWLRTEGDYCEELPKPKDVTHEEIETMIAFLTGEQMFNAAKEYRSNFGDLRVPENYKTSDGDNLGGWIYSHRQRYKQGSLSKERIQRLESIGMIWDARKQNGNFGVT